MPDDGAQAVRDFLRGQNLEHVGRVDDAIALYEASVSAGFDSSGPYDRLIFIYSDRALHADVVRVAEAALTSVRTYEEKRAWYERMRSEAKKAQRDVPRAIPKNRGV